MKKADLSTKETRQKLKDTLAETEKSKSKSLVRRAKRVVLRYIIHELRDTNTGQKRKDALCRLLMPYVLEKQTVKDRRERRREFRKYKEKVRERASVRREKKAEERKARKAVRGKKARAAHAGEVASKDKANSFSSLVG